MKFTIFFSFILALASFILPTSASKNQAKQLVEKTPVGSFKDYWYNAKAEINTYTIEQERYGELRRGDAVLVFVTEELSRSKQVKLDNPEAASIDRVPVLKLNALRKFATGVYDYALMNSVFTPVDYTKDPHSIKLTSSIQDWCGQVFHQFNWRLNNYEAKSYSYFESEADQNYNINTHMLEDELWNRIRIDPTSIQTRKMMLLPSIWYLSMKHKPIKPLDAGVINTKIDEEVSQIEVVYPTIQRSLRIQYETKFPHKILGWEEQNGKDPITKATLKTTVLSPYWSENKVSDKTSRDKLGLMF